MTRDVRTNDDQNNDDEPSCVYCLTRISGDNTKLFTTPTHYCQMGKGGCRCPFRGRQFISPSTLLPSTRFACSGSTTGKSGQAARGVPTLYYSAKYLRYEARVGNRATYRRPLFRIGTSQNQSRPAGGRCSRDIACLFLRHWSEDAVQTALCPIPAEPSTTDYRWPWGPGNLVVPGLERSLFPYRSVAATAAPGAQGWFILQ